MGVPLFADHIKVLTASFDSKLAYVGNPLVRQLRQIITPTTGWSLHLTREARAAGASRSDEAIARDGQID